MNASRNAFTLNSLGVARTPFPFVIKLPSTNAGTTALWICPVAVQDVTDILQKASQAYLFILDFAGVNLMRGTSSLHTLTELAEATGITFQTYEADVISIPSPALLALLEEINHYEFRMIDLPRRPSQEEAYLLYTHFAQNAADPPLATAKCELNALSQPPIIRAHEICATGCQLLHHE